MFDFRERMLMVVKRWGIMPKINQQSVAEHSYFVALYANRIAKAKGMDWSARCMVYDYAIHHDMFEAHSGDIPGPIKRDLLDQTKYNEAQKHFFESMDIPYDQWEPYGEGVEAIVKAANLTDEAFWMLTEISMGNRLLAHMWDNFTSERLCRAYEAIGLQDFFREHVQPALEAIEKGPDYPTNSDDLPPRSFSTTGGNVDDDIPF